MPSVQYVSEIRLCRPHASGPNGRKQIIRTMRGKGYNQGTEEGWISFACVPSIQKKKNLNSQTGIWVILAWVECSHAITEYRPVRTLQRAERSSESVF